MKIVAQLPFWLAAVALIAIALVNNRIIYRVEQEVLLVQKKQDRDERLLMDAIYQAVTRWEQLGEKNPNLIVPMMAAPSPTPEP